MEAAPAKRKRAGDLSKTALYTAQAWVYGGFECSDLLATREAKRVFDQTNFVIRGPAARGGPDLPASLVQRHAMIDHVVRASGAPRVLELAAGLSQRGAVFSKDPGLRYVEIDLPAMIARKRELLARTAEGQKVLERANLELVGADVREVDLVSYLEPDEPACIVAEGLFMYLQAAEQRALWGRVAGALRVTPRGEFVFDLTPTVEKPKPGIAGRFLGFLMKLSTGGRGIEEDDRTRDDIASGLRQAGFDAVELLEPAALKAEWQLPFPDTRTQVVIFHCKTQTTLTPPK